MSEVENASKPKRGKVRRSRTKYTAEQRAQHVAAYRASGKKQEEYAKEVGVNYQTFVNWVHRDHAQTPALAAKPWYTRLWAWVTRS